VSSWCKLGLATYVTRYNVCWISAAEREQQLSLLLPKHPLDERNIMLKSNDYVCGAKKMYVARVTLVLPPSLVNSTGYFVAVDC
jgi:hypothetical protein